MNSLVRMDDARDAQKREQQVHDEQPCDVAQQECCVDAGVRVEPIGFESELNKWYPYARKIRLDWVRAVDAKEEEQPTESGNDSRSHSGQEATVEPGCDGPESRASTHDHQEHKARGDGDGCEEIGRASCRERREDRGAEE